MTLSDRTLRAACFALLPLIALAGSCGDDDETGPIDEGENRAPLVDSLYADPVGTAPDGNIHLYCEAHDPDGDSLTYAWTPVSGEIAGQGADVLWDAPIEEGLYTIRVTVSDDGGDTVTDSVTVAVDAMPGTLLVQSQGGLFAVHATGNRFLFHTSTAHVEVLGDRIFLEDYRGMQEIDHEGGLVNVVQADPPVAGYITVLPDGGFAAITNDSDLIYLVSPDGDLLETLPIPNGSVETLQNVDGVVAGDRLIVSENGHNELFAVDLTTREASIFRSVEDGFGWLGALTYEDGLFVLCRSKRVQTFVEGGPLLDVCNLPVGNISGIAAHGRFAYAVINHAGELYRIDLTTGEYQQMLTGVDYPKDIEYLPVFLAEPTGLVEAF